MTTLRSSDKIELNYYESNRHDRNVRFFGKNSYELLQNSNILVVGAGAIGNEVVKNLALLGVKKLTLVDFDIVSESNTNRCLYFSTSDHGRTKVEVIKERVEAQYDMIIDIHASRIEESPDTIWDDLDLVIVGVDNDMARMLINAKVLSLYMEGQSIPVINGAMARTFVECEVLLPGITACLTCLWTQGYKERLIQDQVAQTCDEFFINILPKFPAISTFTSVVSGIMVAEATKVLILSDFRDLSDKIGVGYLIHLDIEEYSFSKGSIMRNKRCVEPFCSGTYNQERYQALWRNQTKL